MNLFKALAQQSNFYHCRARTPTSCFVERELTYSRDVTDKASLKKVVDEVRATCPPIAGVANGAMVLHDTLFEEMSFSMMQEAISPKIDGSNNLDELFYDDDLDFFVMFSSLACLVGNPGQSNYAAACGYMTSLARQRRLRGVAGSAFDIGRVAGVGYVERAGQVVVDQLRKYGYMAISEAEFHQMFAETIRAGNPKIGAIPVVTTGIRTIRDDEEIKGPWFDNPLFSHCIVEVKGVDAKQDDKKTSLPVIEQVSNAATLEDALEVLKGKYMRSRNGSEGHFCSLCSRMFLDQVACHPSNF